MNRSTLFSIARRVSIRSKSINSSAEYCLDLVRKHDYENFISTILLKGAARSCGFAVRSFNVEVARIAEQVSLKDTGLMRIEFWERTVDKCFSKDFKEVPQHPVAMELFKAINKLKLSRRYLRNLILCRKEHLSINSFKTLEDMEKYCEQSVSNVNYLILEGCGIRNLHADHAASHLGKAQGIVQHLRTLPHAKKINFISVPQDILGKHNVSPEEVMGCRSSQPLSDCVYEIARSAHQHLTKSRSLADRVPSEGRAALLPAVATSVYLDRLQRVNYDIFHASLKHRPWNLLPKIWYASFAKKY